MENIFLVPTWHATAMTRDIHLSLVVRLDLLVLWLPARVYFGAPVDGEGEGETERAGIVSAIHSLILSLRQKMDAASGSRAMISCLVVVGVIRPAYTESNNISL